MGSTNLEKKNVIQLSGRAGRHKPVLVQILGESLQSVGSVALGGGHEISDSGGQRTGWQTGVDVTGAGQADASEGEEGNLRRKISEI